MLSFACGGESFGLKEGTRAIDAHGEETPIKQADTLTPNQIKNEVSNHVF